MPARLRAGRDDWMLRIAEQHAPEAVACIQRNMQMPQARWYAMERRDSYNPEPRHLSIWRGVKKESWRDLRPHRTVVPRGDGWAWVRFHAFKSKAARQRWINERPTGRRALPPSDRFLGYVLAWEQAKIDARLLGTDYLRVPSTIPHLTWTGSFGVGLSNGLLVLEHEDDQAG